jgi:hypothetical protein
LRAIQITQIGRGGTCASAVRGLPGARSDLKEQAGAEILGGREKELRPTGKTAQPAEYNGSEPYRDLSGKTLPGASKFTANIGVNYRFPVLGDKTFHVNFNTAYHTKYYADNSLSKYSLIKAKSLTDFGIGLSARNNSWDVNLIVKNLFDNDDSRSISATSFTPAIGRWVGIQFSGKL